MTTLYQHRIFCITENAWAYKWTGDTTPLTTCPNNTTHTIQPGSESIVTVQAANTVVVNKEPADTTHGIGRVDSVLVHAPAGGTGSTTKVWDFDIAIYSITGAITQGGIGCSLTLDGNPNYPVGTLTAPAPPGTLVLNVTPTAMAVPAGTIISLQDGANPPESLGEAVAVDPTTNTITVSHATVGSFPAGAQVQTTTRAADHVLFNLVGYITFGEDRSIARSFTKGMPLVFKIDNPTASAVDLVFYVSYNY